MKSKTESSNTFLSYARRTFIGIGALFISLLLVVMFSNLFDSDLTPEAKSILNFGSEPGVAPSHNEAYTTLIGLFAEENENAAVIGDQYLSKLSAVPAWETKTCSLEKNTSDTNAAKTENCLQPPPRKKAQHELPPKCRKNRDFCTEAHAEEVTFLNSTRHIVARMNQLPAYGRLITNKGQSNLPVSLRSLSIGTFNLHSGRAIQRAAWSIELALAAKTDAGLSQKLNEVFESWKNSNRFLISSTESEITALDAMVLVIALEANREFMRSAVKTHPRLLGQVETLLKRDSTLIQLNELDASKIMRRAHTTELQILQSTFNELDQSDAAKRQFSFGLSEVALTGEAPSNTASLLDRALLEIGFLPNATVNMVAHAMVHSTEIDKNEFGIMSFVHPRNFVGKFLGAMFASQFQALEKNLIQKVEKLKSPIALGDS
ncbi:MAG: hypothetical protein J0L82_05250 [Deltaproteobacteria bacterium]|nr:hypothetical protein [Deltaproteobacteria bacterium]